MKNLQQHSIAPRSASKATVRRDRNDKTRILPLAEHEPKDELSIENLALTIEREEDEKERVRERLNKLCRSGRFDIKRNKIEGFIYDEIYRVNFDNGSCLTVYLNPINDIQSYMKLEWGPSRVDPDEISNFFHALFGSRAGTILMNANVAQFKAVITADNKEVGMLAHKANVKVSNIQWDKNGEYVVGHIIGSSNSNCHSKIIAKPHKANSAKKGQRKIAKYRIVYVFKKMNCTLDEVWNRLKSEMDKLQWFDPDLLEDRAISNKLAEDIATHGISKALNARTINARKQLLSMLSKRYAIDPITIDRRLYKAELYRCFGFLRKRRKAA